MHRRLLEILVDPIRGQPLSVVDDRGSDPILAGELQSSSGTRYPIIRGVPRFVPSESYSGSFGLQWNRFARVQLDSATGASYSRRRFETEVGWQRRELEGAWVLDAGCGSGRFAEVAASYGAEVIAVDLSSSVDAAMANLGHLPNVHVIQADLRAPPLRRSEIRYLYCIGVLQHTPDPLESARRLVAFLPPGGRFSFTIYGRRPWTRLYSKYWWRPLTRRLPPEKLLPVIERLMPVLFPLTSVLFSLPVLRRLFQFLIPVANYVDRPDLPHAVRYQEAILDTFDMLSPRYDKPVTANEIRRALSSLVASLEFRSQVPVVVQGVRA